MSGAVDFVEDPFIHIVSIVLELSAGAVVVTPLTRFVSGDATYPLLRGVPKQNPKPNEAPQTWTVEDQQAYRAENGAYHAVHKPSDPPGKLTPTFVRGTTKTVAPYDTHEIRYSHDGATWTTCYTIPTSGRGQGWTGATWNPDDEKFWLCLHIWQTADSEGSDTIFEEAQFFTSLDGISWSPDEKFILEFIWDRETGDPNYPVYFLDVIEPEWVAMVTAKFEEKLVKPDNRGGIPDGYQAYDAANKIFMKSTALRGWDLWGIDLGAPAEGITVEGASHPTTSPPGWCLAVSFAGGIWNAWCTDIGALGPDMTHRVYASTDEGRTWLLAHEDHGGANFYGMNAGRAADFTLPAPTEG